MEVTQRPKLWLLRTRRFLFGIGILLMFLAVWNYSPRYFGSANFNRTEVRDGIAYVRYLGIATEEGLLVPYFGTFERFVGLSNDPPDTFQWEWEQDDVGRHCFVPTHWIVNETSSEQGDSRTSLLLPLWLPILLWLIIWPLWIRRLTRKEAAHFAKLQ